MGIPNTFTPTWTSFDLYPALECSHLIAGFKELNGHTCIGACSVVQPKKSFRPRLDE
jgi:hypothetical protein